MAKKKLNSIVWPNIPNDVYYLDADKVEYDDTETYSEGSVGDALQNKANIDGSYENLTAGNAEQIVTDIRANDQTPHLFRTAGGSVDIGDREYINGIVGGTVAWNQLVDHKSKTDRGITATYDPNTHIYTLSGTATGTYAEIFGEVSIITGHKYFCKGRIISNPNSITMRMRILSRTGNYVGSGTELICIGTADGKPNQGIDNFTADTDFSGVQVQYFCFDLTQMFGSTIADYIYSLEQANAGAGVAFFRKLFPKPYYAYNAGELMSVKALRHITRGFNAWDEEWEVGDIAYATGQNATNSSRIRSKNYIHVIPNATYYVKASPSLGLRLYDEDKNYIGPASRGNDTYTIPSNVGYIRFIQEVTTYNNDICINLSWDGERDGEYEEYVEHVYELDPDLELRGIPKLSAGNDLYYDGDVYEADGTVTRYWGERAYQNGDASDFSTMITDGTTTIYKLSTPTTESADPYQNPQIVDDFGTEEFVISNTVAVPIPVGHNTDYPINLKAKVEMAPNSPDGDGDYIVRQTNGTNEYVSIANNSTISGLVSRCPAASGADGTYVLKATISGGTVTYSWEAE